MATARPIVLPPNLTADQAAAVAALLDLQEAERADQAAAFALWPGERHGQPIPEYAEAEARIAARWRPEADGVPEGEGVTGWRRFYAVFGNHPPPALVEQVRTWGYGPSDEELDAFDPAISAYDGRLAS